VGLFPADCKLTRLLGGAGNLPALKHEGLAKFLNLYTLQNFWRDAGATEPRLSTQKDHPKCESLHSCSSLSLFAARDNMQRRGYYDDSCRGGEVHGTSEIVFSV
jgi:hypothetical protein